MTHLNKLEKHMNGDWEGKCCCGFSTYEGSETETGGVMYAFYLLEIHVRKCKKHEKECAKIRKINRATEVPG